MRGVVLIPVNHLGVGELTKGLGLIGLLLLESACVVLLLCLVASIFDAHLLLTALVCFRACVGCLFSLNFLFVFLFVVVDHVPKER